MKPPIVLVEKDNKESPFVIISLHRTIDSLTIVFLFCSISFTNFASNLFSLLAAKSLEMVSHVKTQRHV